MLPFFRLFALPSVVLACSLPLPAQDMPVRVEAAHLLERANFVSLPGSMPNHKEEVTFRAYGLDGTTKEGRFNAILADGGQRYEYVYGDFHSIEVFSSDRMLQNDYQPIPPEVFELERLIPLVVGQFDKSDTIHSITLATLFGRPAKCIQFETVNGRTRQSNEICVDVELGTVVRWNVGRELIEDSEFFQFGGIWLPARIRHYIDGKFRMELEQKFTAIDTPVDWAALTPQNPHVHQDCGQYRRPIAQSAPQPPSAGPGPWYNVRLHVIIHPDGHVYDATVLPAGRPDLEHEAVRIVSGWVFSPALCDGKPTYTNTDLVVHFPPQ